MTTLRLSLMALLVSTFAVAGCASSGAGVAAGAGGEGGTWGSGNGNTTGTGGGATTGSGTTGSAGSGGISGGGTGFTSPQEMFEWVNQTREQYSVHIPYDGYPFQGANADVMTWSALLTWDDGLAMEAQVEAENLAAGAQPEGQYFPYQNEPGEGFSAAGLDTNRYKVSAMSDANTPPGTDVWGNPTPPNKWHHTSNGFYRMAVAYQTGTGAFNHKSKLGVGAADTSSGTITWWVLLFSE
jgi:hypothetical protein